MQSVDRRNASVMMENKEHDKLFAELGALNEQQIEVGLAAGVWNEQVQPLVQHYLYDLKLKRVEAAAKELDETRKVARVLLKKLAKRSSGPQPRSSSPAGQCWQRWQQPSSRSWLCGDTASSRLRDCISPHSLRKVEDHYHGGGRSAAPSRVFLEW